MALSVFYSFSFFGLRGGSFALTHSGSSDMSDNSTFWRVMIHHALHMTYLLI